jgi:hypothetical protein
MAVDLPDDTATPLTQAPAPVDSVVDRSGLPPLEIPHRRRVDRPAPCPGFTVTSGEA